MLDKIKIIFKWVDSINPTIKTILIIILGFLVLNVNFNHYTKRIIASYTKELQDEKLLAEEYTKKITPLVNDCIKDILTKDLDATNVLLLNYHNSLTSTHGLSYRFITTLTEKRRGVDTKSCLYIWRELEYMHYGEEIEKINYNNYLRINDFNDYFKSFPNLIELIKISDAKAAAFYPIKGIGEPKGMIVVLYKKPKTYELGYYNNVIAPSALKLVSLLDYNTIKETLN